MSSPLDHGELLAACESVPVLLVAVKTTTTDLPLIDQNTLSNPGKQPVLDPNSLKRLVASFDPYFLP
jgi:hypothetical protein